MKTYQYQIIRYTHDHFTGEFVNVGIVVYCKDDRFLASKSTNKYRRITQMFPGANGRWILKLLKNFNDSLDKVAEELNAMAVLPESLSHITNAIWIPDHTALHLTEGKMGLDIDLNAALSNLYFMQVEKHNRNPALQNIEKGEDEWKEKYQRYFASRNKGLV